MSPTSSKIDLPGFRPVPRTGVIYVMTEAKKAGYTPKSKSWANLGQGAPEIGALPGSAKRLTSVTLEEDDYEYAPVGGLEELRQAVADLYNARYRKGKKSQYSAENVAIASGGRTSVTRVISSIGRTNIGHFLPDYTAYEELLDSFGSFVPIPILLKEGEEHLFGAAELDNEILGRGLSAILLSNPCNPTGKVIANEALTDWVEIARKRSCTLILDEFYSHYIYDTPKLAISAASCVEDVNADPIVIVDGLTKNWRYPGFRVSWTLAPKEIIEAITSAGSFLDGGCARPMQKAALNLVTQEIADQEATAIKQTFTAKRDYLFKELNQLGIKVDPKPSGGFYCWGDISKLPTELNTGMNFYRQGLDVGVITVPGAFFDINPGHRRPDRKSRFTHYVRFSFGPAQEELERGVASLKKLLKK